MVIVVPNLLATGTPHHLPPSTSAQLTPPPLPSLRASLPLSHQIYPIKLAQDAIYVDVNKGTLGGYGGRGEGKGGAGTSAEGNNVFTVQPNVYFEGMDPATQSASVYASGPNGGLNPAVVLTGVVATGIVAVIGTAVCLYTEVREGPGGMVPWWGVRGERGRRRAEWDGGHRTGCAERVPAGVLVHGGAYGCYS